MDSQQPVNPNTWHERSANPGPSRMDAARPAYCPGCGLEDCACPEDAARPASTEQLAADRAKIVAALNLTPLVPPNAAQETLNVVDDAWAALASVMARVADLEAALTEIVAANPQGKLSLRGGESWEIARRALDATDGEGQ